ncbi:SAM-dependent methyltransferase [Taibaiella lutea]|uniref:SAM-dependent methyltransferase n=1 Tax=Taibaiella lutea TaxID=2608001 RepID=A0A5M6CNV4_9BACT|nr:SAM-dependent methyltransferase [Taibaiella lutea]KAA5536908.1 SAM-dependent methyltransferase [Taibaiella lutea]
MTKVIGKLYLIPVPLAENALETIPENVKTLSCSLKYFFVENVRTARRYLKSIDKSVDIDAIQFQEINSQTSPDLNIFRQWLKEGNDVGMMSEAGCPGMADPGSDLAAVAQEMGATVIPLVGPSSVLLALMASGFNGQGFRFAGYLPIKEPIRGKAIKELETISAERKETQLFIETPYRNNQMLKDIIRLCKQQTKLCIAADITDEKEFIKTKTVGEWAKEMPDLHKRPTIFLLMA